MSPLTNAQKQQRRREALDEVAREAGYDSHYVMMTAIANREAIVIKVDKWTDEKEQAYQDKLAQAPQRTGYTPAELKAHKKAMGKWYATLTPEEKLRYGAGTPTIS